MQRVPFEEKRFCQIRTLAERWDMPIRRLMSLAEKGVIRFWHPEGQKDRKGRLVDVGSILEAEKKGYIEPVDV